MDNIKIQDELIDILRDEFEYTEEYKGKFEFQWLMGVSLNKIFSNEYLVRVSVKTSESPYIDGMSIKVSVVNGRVKLEEDYFEQSPELMGSPEADAVKWHENLGEVIYLQLENPNDEN